jgi:LPS export ABC transporter protein LptC
MQEIVILALYKTYYRPFAVILLLLLLLASCGELSQKNKQKVNKALTDSLTSTTEAQDMTMNLIVGGNKKVQLHGRYAATFNTKKINETRISGPVSIRVYDSTHTVTTWVHSDSAIYRSKTADFKLFGNVRVRTKSKKHLQSEYLDWDQASDRISTPRFVIITTPTDSIAGTGFTGTTDLSHYKIKNPSGRVTF